jgi:hypothetical protein
MSLQDLDATISFQNLILKLQLCQTSQPSPQAPSVGDSQLSSTKRTSCLVKSSPISLKDSKYKS